VLHFFKLYSAIAAEYDSRHFASGPYSDKPSSYELDISYPGFESMHWRPLGYTDEPFFPVIPSEEQGEWNNYGIDPKLLEKVDSARFTEPSMDTLSEAGNSSASYSHGYSLIPTILSVDHFNDRRPTTSSTSFTEIQTMNASPGSSPLSPCPSNFDGDEENSPNNSTTSLTAIMRSSPQREPERSTPWPCRYHDDSLPTSEANVPQAIGAPRAYPCPREGCPHMSSREYDLERHLESMVHKDPSHKCVSCGQCFTRCDSLKRHRARRCARARKTTGGVGNKMKRRRRH
jgi:hypothetical protein